MQCNRMFLFLIAGVEDECLRVKPLLRGIIYPQSFSSSPTPPEFLYAVVAYSFIRIFLEQHYQYKCSVSAGVHKTHKEYSQECKHFSAVCPFSENGGQCVPLDIQRPLNDLDRTRIDGEGKRKGR